MNNTVEINLWGTRVGIATLDKNGIAMFQYDNDFRASGIELSPIHMPLSAGVYSFPNLPEESFHGLPGLLADSLPDKFGNAVISQWLAQQGLTDGSFNAIDRLCYMGSRGMGALEYVPANGPVSDPEEHVNISAMVEFASQILNNRKSIHFSMDENISFRQLLQLGTSAGGARAKAVIAWNEETGDIRSGQINAGNGYSYCIIKFDGVDNNGDHGLQDGPRYTLIEYAYYLMAKDAGMIMNECRLLHENGRSHFMTKRFDRTDEGGKIHMQTLGAMAHIDYNTPCLCSYEEASVYSRRIGLPEKDIEQLYRRMVFNILAVNHDDHVKNISFLMDRNGSWRLAPAYDITYAYDSNNRWLAAHQMTVNGKNRAITDKDILDAGSAMDISSARCKRILDEVSETISKWPEYAQSAGVPEETMESIKGLQVRAESYS